MDELVRAATKGLLSQVKTIIQSWTINHTHYNQALLSAAKNGHHQIIQYLIEKGADVNFGYKYDYTPLIIASCNGHTEAVKTLVNNNADLELKNEYGETALICATRNKHYDTVHTLIRAGADIHTTTNLGRTARDHALENSYHQIIDLIDSEPRIRKRIKLIAPLRRVQQQDQSIQEPFYSLTQMPEHLFRKILLYGT